MALSDRKIQILQAIINDYIETAEPVGSRTIAKKYNLGISISTPFLFSIRKMEKNVKER